MAARADQYWTYTYKDVEVMAPTSTRALEIAHNLHRLDLALAIVLGLKSASWQPRTQVCVVPGSTLSLMWGADSGSLAYVYRSSTFDNRILMNSSVQEDGPSYGAYFGYTGSLLSSTYSFRYPDWYIHGLSAVFAASSVQRDRVIIGDFVAARLRPFADNAWIPIKTLLALHGDDPQLKSTDYEGLYEAESWFLVHEIAIERMYQSNFNQYFSRLDDGEEESQAFAASFDITYEALDKELRDAFRKGRIRLVKVPVPEENDPGAPRRLNDSEAKGRLALFAAHASPQIDGALKLANDSLASDPKNEDALSALAQIHVRQHDYAAALQSADRLCALNASQRTSARCGEIYAELYYRGAAKNPTLGVDAPALAQRARKSYEAAIAADPEDLASWTGLANILANSRDVDNANNFLPRAKHEWAIHDNAMLAEALSGLCAAVGDYDSAVKFAVVWRKHALSRGSRAAADMALSRLKTAAAGTTLLKPAAD